MKGIYKITQKSTGKIYIGQSINIYARWNSHITAIDNLSFHAAYRKDPTDFIFEILTQNDSYTTDDLDLLEKNAIKDYKSNDPKYGFNSTAGNGKNKNVTASQMRRVKGSVDLYINSHYLRNASGKKILVIGNFNISESALYNNMTIITDDFDFMCENARIIRVNDWKEIVAQLNTMETEKFDMIIANPPYNRGNEVISKCVEKSKDTIVLMPFLQYADNELYKHIVTITSADPKIFEDASVQKNLCICKLIDRKIDQSFEFIESQLFDSEYAEFYKLNQPYCTQFEKYRFKTIKHNEPISDDIKKEPYTFMMSVRVGGDGCHKGEKSADYRWNKLNDKNPRDIIKSSFSLVKFPNQKYYDNFTTWWYENPLQDKLIKGLKRSQSSVWGCLCAIPAIDFSVDRDYAHLTYKELLEIIKKR